MEKQLEFQARDKLLNHSNYIDINKFKTIDNMIEENIKCDVCLWDDDCENDEIVICDMCLAATH